MAVSKDDHAWLQQFPLVALQLYRRKVSFSCVDSDGAGGFDHLAIWTASGAVLVREYGIYGSYQSKFCFYIPPPGGAHAQEACLCAKGREQIA